MPRTTPAGPGFAVTEAGVARGLTVDERGYLHVDIRLEPGDVLAISLEAASNTAVTAIGLNWQEI